MRLQRLVALVLIPACGCLLWQTTGTPGAQAKQTDTAPQIVRPGSGIATTPPPVTVKGTKEGAKASANQKADGRIKTNAKESQPTKAVVEETTNSENNPLKPAPKQGSQKKDIRLNVGVCGRMGPEGDMPGPLRCEPELDVPDPTPNPTVPPEVVQPPRPQDVTWEEVLTESKNVAFPPRRVMVQPAERTLVNLDTIVYTTESGISTDVVTLLGFPVEVEATPISYTWNFGDGGPNLITTTPGKPHPAKEITHKYLKRASVNLTLTTNYAARFNVAGTGWQYVAGTVPITGPATALLVREAVPVLVDPPN